jgi:hypothetical protein
MRLSRVVATRLPAVSAEGANSGVDAADLEPCNETPRTVALLFVGTGRLFKLCPADAAGRGAHVGVTVVVRDCDALDVKPGGGVVVPAGGTTVLGPGTIVPGGAAFVAGGTAAPEGCHAGGGDDGDA